MTRDELDSKYRSVFVRDLKLDAEIGVLPSERGVTQPVLLEIRVWLEDTAPAADVLEAVYDYRTLVRTAEAVFAAGHIGLQETAVEGIAERLLADHRVRACLVRSEKTAAGPSIGAYGVQILRERP